MTEVEQRRQDLTHLNKLFEEELSDVLEVSDSLDMSRVPNSMKMVVELITAKFPTFSNVAALAIANFMVSSLISQARPRINDPSYSSDTLGLNSYSILISESGSGKSGTKNTLTNIFKPAMDLVHKSLEKDRIRKAKNKALKLKQKDDANATEEDLETDDWKQFVKEIPSTMMSGSSTKAGLSTMFGIIQREKLLSCNLIIDELGIEMKQGQNINDVFHILGEMYDNGIYVAPMYKTEELREETITDQYPNFLGYTSPNVLFKDEKVRANMYLQMVTMFARRSWYIHPGHTEANENNKVATSIKEGRLKFAKNKEVLSGHHVKIENTALEAMQTMLSSEAGRIVTFSDDAAQLYEDYKLFCQNRSELWTDRDDAVRIEVAGRAFKTARLASVWSLFDCQNEVPYEIMAQAINFAEYCSKYIAEFVRLCSAKSYMLLGDEFVEGNFESLTLDKAMRSGYVRGNSRTHEDLLEPLNSYIKDEGVVSYNTKSREFVFKRHQKVEEIKTDKYWISYTKIPVLEGESFEDLVKDERKNYLDNFNLELDMEFIKLKTLVSSNTVFSVFRYKDSNGVKRKRGQDYLRGSTKLLALDVDVSQVPIQDVHEYLEDYRHLIATTSNSDNKYKFRILLPINVELNCDNMPLYRYVCKRVSIDLLMEVDPASFNPAQPVYGYHGAEVLMKEEGALFDVTEYVAQYQTDKDVLAQDAELPKTEPAKKKLRASVMNNLHEEFGYAINAPHGKGSYSLITAAIHMAKLEFTKKQYIAVINYIHDQWEQSMESSRFNKILNQEIHRFKD